MNILKSASLSKVFNHLFNLIWLILLHYFKEFNNKTFSIKKNLFLLIPPEHYYASLCSPEGILVWFQFWSNFGVYQYSISMALSMSVWLHLHFELMVHTMSSEQSTLSKWFRVVWIFLRANAMTSTWANKKLFFLNMFFYSYCGSWLSKSHHVLIFSKGWHQKFPVNLQFLVI